MTKRKKEKNSEQAMTRSRRVTRSRTRKVKDSKEVSSSSSDDSNYAVIESIEEVIEKQVSTPKLVCSTSDEETARDPKVKGKKVVAKKTISAPGKDLENVSGKTSVPKKQIKK